MNVEKKKKLLYVLEECEDLVLCAREVVDEDDYDSASNITDLLSENAGKALILAEELLDEVEEARRKAKTKEEKSETE